MKVLQKMYDPVASTVLYMFGTCIIERYLRQSAFPLFYYDLHCESVGNGVNSQTGVRKLKIRTSMRMTELNK